VFETHYNLAIVYTQAEDYVNAVEEYKKVIEMKPQMADSYYSLATAENNLAIDIAKGTVKMNQDGSLYTPKSEDVNFEEKVVLSESEQSLVAELYDSAIENYQKYLELAPDAKDRADVEEQIKKLEEYKTTKVQ
jgi:tetratricopeptide (TPR) repeat protein